MKVFVSSLIRDFSKMAEVSGWINSLGNPDIGVELIAFTHDDAYWQELCAVLKRLRCPISFHGPYIGTEGTSAVGTPAQLHLMESYRRTFELAKEYGVRHVVYHTTQLPFAVEEVDAMRTLADQNVEKIMELAHEFGVEALVENLPYPPLLGKVPLYTNQQYFDFFEKFPKVNSIIDVGHAHINKLDLGAFLRRNGERVKAYHFHNNNGARDSHNHILDGTFSYEAFAALYRQYTPNTNIVLEYEPHVALSDEALMEQIEYVQKLFA